MSQDQHTTTPNTTTPESTQSNQTTNVLGDLFTTQNEKQGEKQQNKTPPGGKASQETGETKNISSTQNTQASIPQVITPSAVQEGSIVTIQKSPGPTTNQTIPIIINTSPNAHTHGSPQNTINLPISIGNNLPQATIVIQIF